MVHAEQVQGGGVEVVNVDGLIDGFEAEVICRAIGGAALNAPAGEDGGETPAVVVAAVLIFDKATDFDDGRAAEFAADDDKRFVEQAAGFEVL